MKLIITSFRVILVLGNTMFQISRLMVDSWINGNSIERSFKHRRRWARSSTKLLGIKVEEVQGQLKVDNALIISNHRTLLDPVIQAAFIDAYIIAKAEVSKLPVISQGAQMTGIIFVKRERLRSRAAAKEKTREVLLGGKNVLVYAEGTTGVQKISDPFKPGTFAVAAKNEIPVIPVSIEYKQEKDFWAEGSLFQQMVRQIGPLATKAKLRIGEPIKHDDPVKLLELTKSAIDEQLLTMQRGWSEVFEEG